MAEIVTIFWLRDSVEQLLNDRKQRSFSIDDSEQIESRKFVEYPTLLKNSAIRQYTILLNIFRIISTPHEKSVCNTVLLFFLLCIFVVKSMDLYFIHSRNVNIKQSTQYSDNKSNQYSSDKTIFDLLFTVFIANLKKKNTTYVFIKLYVVYKHINFSKDARPLVCFHRSIYICQ